MLKIIREYGWFLITSQLISSIRSFARCDYLATKTGAIIVPSCGFDSVPSDTAAYLANKTLKSIGPSTNGEYLKPDISTSAFSFRGGISGGTIASFMTAVEEVPRNVLRDAGRPYSTSPFVGALPPLPFRVLHKLSIPGMKSLIGGHFIMGPGNTALVQRSYGLFELQAKTGKALNCCFFFLVDTLGSKKYVWNSPELNISQRQGSSPVRVLWLRFQVC